MVQKNNTFLNEIKVSKGEAYPNASPSTKDRYVCLKVMQDLSKIYDFLISAQNRDSGTNSENKSLSETSNHYFIINKQLGDIEYNFREGKITSAEFSSNLDKICNQYKLNFDHLLDITQSIDSLGRYPSHEQINQLSQQLNSEVLEYKESLNIIKE